jgi:ABC-type branched-subunit amino acid transport system permease subunit
MKLFLEYTERYLLIIGLIFIVIILLAPRGIVGTLSAHWRAASGENRT